MTGPITQLTDQETEVLQILRGLPGPETQARVIAHLKNVAFWIATPRCQGVMAEGFPCGNPPATCDECHEVWDVLDKLNTIVGCKKDACQGK